MANTEDAMLTTADNPNNPFTNFDEWYAFDTSMGYHTCAYLDRVTRTSDELSEEEQALAIEKAINKIIELNLTGNYLKVTKSNFKDLIQNKKP